ncbi:MAG: hypothetical protein PVJ86_05245 [Phycisphaerales bacterium]|jgi:hypothetical protein
MIATSAMTAGANAVFLALTPTERWQAMRRFGGSLVGEGWFVPVGLAAVIILTALLIVVSYNRAAKERKISNKLFSEYAYKMGLSRRERQLLQDIAGRAKLRRNESIFTMVSAFDRGAAGIIKETLALQEAETSKHLGAELSVLREKLGFKKRHPASAGLTAKSSKPNSRQIPAGKKLHITRRDAFGPADIECTVIKNDDTELAVKLATPLGSSPGELCCVRYYFGASVWEFDASVISCHGGILVLNHSDNVRFVNRRRFLRVPVDKPAFIARFPFARTLLPNGDGGERTEQGSANVSADTWGPPEFVPAAVTELAGPGLRIEAPLEVKVGERVVVILKVSEEGQQDSITDLKDTSPGSILLQKGKTTQSRIVEDIGEVRHAEPIQNGFSIAVELTGLSDSNVSELIRATNAASLKAGARTQDVPVSGGSENNREMEVAEPVVMQGV